MLDTLPKPASEKLDDPLEQVFQTMASKEMKVDTKAPETPSDAKTLVEDRTIVEDRIEESESGIDLKIIICETEAAAEEVVELDCTQLNGEKTNDDNIDVDFVTDSQSFESETDGGASLMCPNTLTETNNERKFLQNLDIITTRKREKSMTDSTLDRKKKRVKFNPQEDNDEVVVHTLVFEEVNPLDALIKDSDIISNTPLASKLKRLLKQKSKLAVNAACDTTAEKKENLTSEEEAELSACPIPSEDGEELAFIDDEASDEESKRGNNQPAMENKNKKIEDSLSVKSNGNNEETNVCSMKREGTFTLEESPPAKSMRPSTSIENIFNEEKDNLKFCKQTITYNTHEVNDNKSDEKFTALEKEGKIHDIPTEDVEPMNKIEAKKKIAISTYNEAQSETKVEKQVSFAESRTDHNKSTENLTDNKYVNSKRNWSQGAVELKADSLASKRRAKVNVEKRFNSHFEDRKEEAVNGELLGDKPKSPSFRNSAKKTLINAWKSAMKGSTVNENTIKIAPQKIEPFKQNKNSEEGSLDTCVKTKSSKKIISSESNEENQIKVKKILDQKISCSAKSSQPKVDAPKLSKMKSFRSCRTGSKSDVGSCSEGNKSELKKDVDTLKSNRGSIVGTKSEKAPIVGKVLPFRRDGTFTKCPTKWSRQFDAEKSRLEAEVRKYSADNERLEREAVELRAWCESEEAARKASRREHATRLRELREQEARKREGELGECKERLSEQHREALCQQKTSLQRGSEAALQRLGREHAEAMRRLRQQRRTEATGTCLTLRVAAGDAGGRTPDSSRTSSPSCSSNSSTNNSNTNNNTEKLVAEMGALKEAKKKLEDSVQTLQATERSRCYELREQQRQHDTAVAGLTKTARHDQGKMMDELKSRDRTICQLGRQLAQGAAKLQLVMEENRARSAEKPAEAARRPLSRSNSSPGQQQGNRNNNSTNSNKNSTNNSKSTINSKSNNSKQQQQQQQRDDSLTTEGPEMFELSRLREEVEQQRRTIRQLSVRGPRETYREDQPMSLGHLPSISMDNILDTRTLLQRGRYDSGSSDWFHAMSELRQENKNLKSELQEARDQSDLLEFRILELTEGSDRFSESDEVCSIREVGGSGVEEVESPTGGEEGSGSSSLATGGVQQQEDHLSLPLSIDSGLDLTVDYRKSRNSSSNNNNSPSFKIGSTTPPINNNNNDNINDTSKSTMNHQHTNTDTTSSTTHIKDSSSTAMEVVSMDEDNSRQSQASPTTQQKQNHSSSSSPPNSTRESTNSIGSGVTRLDHSSKRIEVFDVSEVSELAAKLQECLASPNLQEEALLQAINKLRCLGNTLTGLHSKVSGLTDENQYLQDALSALSDAHETRTEASGTESEIVNRKTPSLHSDLSDSESDGASTSSSSEAGARSSKKRLEVTTSFQESGIFDGPCDVHHASTQTEASGDGIAAEPSGGAPEDLSSAVARLTSIRSAVQGGGVHMRLQDMQEGEELLKSVLPLSTEHPSKGELSATTSVSAQQEEDLLCHIAQLKDDLENIGTEKQKLQEAYDQLKLTIIEQNNRLMSSCRRCSEYSEVERGQSKVLREQLRVAESARRHLYDDKCELEEAENDARLMVQRLDSQLTAAREMECLLSASLSQEQEISRELHRKVKELQSMEKERTLRQGILERQSMSSVERVASLVMDRDSYASQLSFVKNGLILLHVYEQFRRRNSTGAMMPFNIHRANAAATAKRSVAFMNIDTTSGSSAPMEVQEVVDEFGGESSPLSSPSRSGSSCVMVDCAIDEALMEISDDSITCSTSATYLNDSTPSVHISSTNIGGNIIDTSTEMEYSTTFNLEDMIAVSSKTGTNFTNDFLSSSSMSGFCDSSVQTVPGRFIEGSHASNSTVLTIGGGIASETKELNFPVMPEISCINEIGDNSSRQSVTRIHVQTSQALEGPGPETKETQTNKIELRTRSTMTEGEELLSQRERYYLEQIQGLQDEKMNLRKDQEQERLESLQQCEELENALQELESQLTESEKRRANLQCSLEEAREQREDSCRDLHHRIQEIRTDMTRSSDLHELEKSALRRDFDARLSEIGNERRRYIDRVLDLEQQLTALRQELEVVGVAIVTDMTGYDGQPHKAASPSPVTSNGTANKDVGVVPATLGISSGSELLDKIRQLIKSESSLRRKITELESKESAYRETIDKADKIMSSHVTTYAQRIEELENMNDQSKDRIRLLEKNEDRLRTTLTTSSRNDHDSRVAELLQQLINTERSELEFKAKLYSLEKNEKQLRIELMEGEKVQQNLRGELKDQEDILHRIQALQADNNNLTHQLQQAHDSVRRVSDVQQSEHFLKGRVEELESSELNLREALHQASLAHTALHRRLSEQVFTLDEEVHSIKSQLEAATQHETESRDTEQALRRQLDSVKMRLQESERDLKETSSETMTHETQYRNEVCKVRSQLKLSNSQLTELESISCSLRERLAASDHLKDALEKQLEERKRRHESDLLQLNLQASQREHRLEETEGALCELTQLHAVHELDVLASTALAPLIRSLTKVATEVKLCTACSSSNGESVHELKSQLNTLTDLLNGSSHSDTEDNAEDSDEETDTSLVEPSRSSSVDINAKGTSILISGGISTISVNNGSPPSVVNTDSANSSSSMRGSSSSVLLNSTDSPAINALNINSSNDCSSNDNSNNSLTKYLNSSPTTSSPIVKTQSNSSLSLSTHTSLTSDSFSTGDESQSSLVLKQQQQQLELNQQQQQLGRPGSPVPVPAPRRKRKQKREDTASLRGSFRARKKGNTTILEELEEKVGELEEKVRELEESTTRKEEELRLADSEAAELNGRLQATQQIAIAKESEVCEFRRALADLQQQLVLSIESHEITKIKLESKYKAGEEDMVTRVLRLTVQWERLADRGQLKDRIIATLVAQIRALLRTTNMGVVITQIKQISDKVELKKQRTQQQQEELLRQQHDDQVEAVTPNHRIDGAAEESDEEQDFDVESVCELLAQPMEVSDI